MTKEELKKLTDEYLRLDQELRDFTKQFIFTVWGDKVLDVKHKALTLADAEKMAEMRKAVDKAHEEWLEGLQHLYE